MKTRPGLSRIHASKKKKALRSVAAKAKSVLQDVQANVMSNAEYVQALVDAGSLPDNYHTARAVVMMTLGNTKAAAASDPEVGKIIKKIQKNQVMYQLKLGPM